MRSAIATQGSSGGQAGCLEKPLVIRASVIRRPEFFPQKFMGDSLSEEGDMLFPALGGQAPLSDPFGLQPVLCLPPTVESYYEGEFFKALVSIVNVAPYPVRDVEVEIDGHAPSKARHTLCHQLLPQLGVKGAFSRVVQLPLLEVGKHLMEVRCRCVDTAGHLRELTWSSAVAVAAGLREEFGQVVRRIPVPLYADLSTLGLKEGTEVYGLDVHIKNCTSSFATLTSCFLDLHVRSPYTVLATLQNQSGGIQGNFFRSSTPHRASLPPGERHHFVFYISLSQRALRSVPTKVRGSERVAVVTSTVAEVGALRWSWQRHKGDGGSARSGRIWLDNFVAPPKVEVRLQSLRSDRSDPRDATRAGEPVRLGGVVLVHKEASAAYAAESLMLKVRPERLAPDWLYAGPTLLPLDNPGTDGDIWQQRTFELPLIPWRDGELSIPYNALEVVSATDTQCVVWPASPAWIQEKGTAPTIEGKFVILIFEYFSGIASTACSTSSTADVQPIYICVCCCFCLHLSARSGGVDESLLRIRIFLNFKVKDNLSAKIKGLPPPARHLTKQIVKLYFRRGFQFFFRRLLVRSRPHRCGVRMDLLSLDDKTSLEGAAPIASSMNSLFGAAVCGTPSDLRLRSNAAFVPIETGSMPAGGDPSVMGASPVNTSIFSGMTPLVACGTNLFSPVSSSLAADRDAPPAIRKGMTATFTRNNNNNSTAAPPHPTFERIPGSSGCIPVPRAPGSDRSGSPPGRSKAIPISSVLGEFDRSMPGSPYLMNYGARASRPVGVRGMGWSRGMGTPGVQPISPSFGSLMMPGTPDSAWDPKHDSFAVDASLTAGVNTNYSFAVGTAPRDLAGTAGEMEIAASVSDNASLFCAKRFSAMASGFFGESNYSRPTHMMPPTGFSMHVDPARLGESGPGSSSDTSRKAMQEYMEPSRLADSFSEMPCLSLPKSDVHGEILFGHSDPLARPLTDSPNLFPLEGISNRSQLVEMLADPDERERELTLAHAAVLCDAEEAATIVIEFFYYYDSRVVHQCFGSYYVSNFTCVIVTSSVVSIFLLVTLLIFYCLVFMMNSSEAARQKKTLAHGGAVCGFVLFVKLEELLPLAQMSAPQPTVPSQGGHSIQDHLNVVHPDIGKRYRLNFSGEVNRLSVGKIKQCLATASSCPIPLDKMVLKLNGVPLSDDRDICGALGIGSGATLSVEHVKHVEPYLHRHVDAHGHDTVLDHMGSYASPKRRQLEVQTVREQEFYLRSDLEAQERLLHGTLAHIEEDLYKAQLEKQRLERSRSLAEQGLREVSRQEAVAAKEKGRLSSILAEEAERASQRAADLEMRREKLRLESEAMRAVAMQKLALEEHKAKLAEEKAQFRAEQMKVEQEQQMFETLAKEREAQILTQEIELEHAQLAQARQKQELEVQRRIAVEQKMHYYQQLGLSTGDDSSGLHSPTPPPAAPHHRPSVSFAGENIWGRSDRVAETTTPTSSKGLAEANLRLLSESLEAPSPLQFDENGTCAFSVGAQYSLLVFYDESTDWLTLYSTLVTAIPAQETELCLQLFTFVLENLQPGSNGSAGGLSAAFHEGSIILSVGIHLPSSQPWALKSITPSFVQCLQEWRSKIGTFMQQRARVARAGQGPSAPVLGLEVTDTLLVNGVATPCTDGVIVVNSSGLAAAAGVERNDWIKRVNALPTPTKEAFQHAIQQLHPYQTVEVEHTPQVEQWCPASMGGTIALLFTCAVPHLTPYNSIYRNMHLELRDPTFLLSLVNNCFVFGRLAVCTNIEPVCLVETSSTVVGMADPKPLAVTAPAALSSRSVNLCSSSTRSDPCVGVSSVLRESLTKIEPHPCAITAPESLLILMRRYLSDASVAVPQTSCSSGLTEPSAPSLLLELFPFKAAPIVRIMVHPLDQRRAREERWNENAMWFTSLAHSADFSKSVSFSFGLLHFLMSLKELDPGRSGSGTSFRRRYHEFYHQAHSVPEAGKGVFQTPTISQLISVPFIALQCFSSLVMTITKHFLSRRPGGTSSYSAGVAKDAYRAYFNHEQRELVIAACTLLAWKLSDGDASVNIFQMSASSASGSRDRGPPRERNGRGNYFTVFQESTHSLTDIVRMEAFIFGKLKCRVGAAPIWWRVAVEVLQLYFYDYRIKGVVAHSRVLSHSLIGRSSASVDKIRSKAQVSDYQLHVLLEKMHLGLEQMMLLTTSILQLPGRISHLTAAQRKDFLEDMQDALVGNPIFGFAVAVHKGGVPLEWVASLSEGLARPKFITEIEKLCARVGYAACYFCYCKFVNLNLFFFGEVEKISPWFDSPMATPTRSLASA
eukprot:gene9102-6395_t